MLKNILIQLIAVFAILACTNAQARTFNLINNCPSTVQFTVLSGATPYANGLSHCSSDSQCIAGASCNTGNGVCYWATPQPSTGQFQVAPNGGTNSITFPYFANNGQNILWSGNIGGCYEGTCGNCGAAGCGTADGGPMTRAEFTLSLRGSDFYDVEVINGHNIPMAMYAKSNAFDSNNPYTCGAPGAPAPQTAVGGCNWNLSPPSVYYNWVSTGGNSCNSNGDCGGQTCGLSNNVGQAQRFRLTCGNLLGYWTANQVCGIDPSFGAPFNCNQMLGGANNGISMTMMYACSNGLQSCYADGAGSGCCGCQNWNELGLSIPSQTTQCKNSNPNWQQNVLPTLSWLKKACPTAYTFPYDDMSSTFTCQSNNGNGFNTVDYDIVWCPSGASTPSNNGNNPSQPTPNPPTPNPPSPPPPSTNGVSWVGAGPLDWAMGCDFVGDDIGSTQVAGAACGPSCLDNTQCTHFAWTPPSNCWLKGGAVSHSNAFVSGTAGIVCGLRNTGSNAVADDAVADFAVADSSATVGNTNTDSTIPSWAIALIAVTALVAVLAIALTVVLSKKLSDLKKVEKP